MPIIVRVMLDALILEIEQHIAARADAGQPLAESTLGLRAVNDGKLMERLRGGGQITVGKADRIRKWIASDREAMGLPLPVHVGQSMQPQGSPVSDAKPEIVQ